MGQTLDCFCKGIEFIQSHRPEEAIPNTYDKFEPGLKKLLHSVEPKGLQLLAGAHAVKVTIFNRRKWIQNTNENINT